MATVITHGPALVVALAREHLIARRSWRAGPYWSHAPCHARWYVQQGCPFLLVETGVGTLAAERALSWLLQRASSGNDPYQPSLVISAGFSGALQPEQRVGDLILANEVTDASGQIWPLSVPDTLRDLLHCCIPSLQAGRILATAHLVERPAEKRFLGQHLGALAVDMESAVLARRCQEQGVPLVCLRVIADHLNTVLSPQLVALLKAGRVNPGRLIGTLLRQPGMLRELWRLAAQTRYAARQLAKPLNYLLGRSAAKRW